MSGLRKLTLAAALLGLSVVAAGVFLVRPLDVRSFVLLAADKSAACKSDAVRGALLKASENELESVRLLVADRFAVARLEHQTMGHFDFTFRKSLRSIAIMIFNSKSDTMGAFCELGNAGGAGKNIPALLDNLAITDVSRVEPCKLEAVADLYVTYMKVNRDFEQLKSQFAVEAEAACARIPADH